MKEVEVECNVQFLNSKSVELFGFDMLNTESSQELKELTELPMFKKAGRLQSELSLKEILTK